MLSREQAAILLPLLQKAALTQSLPTLSVSEVEPTGKETPTGEEHQRRNVSKEEEAISW